MLRATFAPSRHANIWFCSCSFVHEFVRGSRFRRRRAVFFEVRLLAVDAVCNDDHGMGWSCKAMYGSGVSKNLFSGRIPTSTDPIPHFRLVGGHGPLLWHL